MARTDGKKQRAIYLSDELWRAVIKASATESARIGRRVSASAMVEKILERSRKIGTVRGTR